MKKDYESVEISIIELFGSDILVTSLEKDNDAFDKDWEWPLN